ncbi:DUF4304 domain-containing protein [Gimesia aquarii]|uniref:DUF4304 domain-containing protein n=1 Tax=Gimesia aquarii TaxID=2527964 RepID=A0A517X0J8_9PLAN|nr:DUF4304 domain-containing protein [Gimesia aquarii]QDU11038.1 hypothetical protein V202x_44540 [Gimesia aquarii]
MNQVLKELVIPKLRGIGFRGSMPHFRRLRDEQTDLLTFQFSTSGGKFVVEVAFASAGPFETSWGKIIERKKLTAHDLNNRLRLGPKVDGENDFWFIYEGANARPMHELAELLNTHIQTEAETYWNREN